MVDPGPARRLSLPHGSLRARSAPAFRPGQSDLAVRCAGRHRHVDSWPQLVLGGIHAAQMPARRLLTRPCLPTRESPPMALENTLADRRQQAFDGSGLTGWLQQEDIKTWRAPRRQTLWNQTQDPAPYPFKARLPLLRDRLTPTGIPNLRDLNACKEGVDDAERVEMRGRLPLNDSWSGRLT